jgi:hypothetical protein
MIETTRRIELGSLPPALPASRLIRIVVESSSGRRLVYR